MAAFSAAVCWKAVMILNMCAGLAAIASQHIKRPTPFALMVLRSFVAQFGAIH